MDRLHGRQARVGDLFVVHPRHVNDSERVAEILEVMGTEGYEHFRVRWEDGRESLFFPASDTTLRPREREGVEA
jgi:uncharacterized protein DUF1918